MSDWFRFSPTLKRKCRHVSKWQLTLHWRHNDHDRVSNHQPHGCLLNRLFRRRSKKTSKLRVTGLCVGNSPGPVNSPHKGPVTRKMFSFDDVIMIVQPAMKKFRQNGDVFVSVTVRKSMLPVHYENTNNLKQSSNDLPCNTFCATLLEHAMPL